MKRRPSFDVWVVGVLTSFLCLLFVARVTAEVGFNPLSFLNRTAPEPIAKPPSVRAAAAQPKTSPGPADSSHRAAPKLESSRISRNVRTGKVVSAATSSMSTPQPQITVAQSNPPLDPERKILKPFGYVQKADGLVEAFVSDEYGVHLVHVGDQYEEEFTVASVASDAVELVAVSPKPALSPPSEVVVASNSEPASNRPSVAAVNRVRAPNSVRSGGHAPGPPNSPPKPESPSTSLVVANAPQNLGIPSSSLLGLTGHKPLATLNGVERSPGTEAPVAFQSPAPTANRDREDAQFAVANVPSRRLPVERPETPGPISAGEVITERQTGGLAPSASSGLDPPKAAVTEGRGPPTHGPPNTSIVESYGYVEWQDGRTLAVVDDGRGGVRLDQEGDVIDDRSQVARAYPQAVEVTELPFVPSGLTTLRSLELAFLDPTPSVQGVSSMKSVGTEEAADAAPPKHLPPQSIGDPCVEGEQANTIAAQANPPPDLGEPPLQQTGKSVLAAPTTPPTGPGIADSAKRLNAAPSALWDLAVPGGRLPLFSLVPSTANAGLSLPPRSSAAAPAGPGSGLYNAPSGCSATVGTVP